jgi:hypothetical protein
VHFEDPLLLFTQPGDPRLDHLSDYKLVATTDATLPRSSFKAVVNARGCGVDSVGDLQQRYVQRTARYYSMLLNLMNVKLLSNPYFDILQFPLDLNEFLLPSDLHPELIARIQFTKTFARWRQQKMSREQTRNAFLSLSPRKAVAIVQPADYDRALEQLEVIRNFSLRDGHLNAVLRVHMALIRRKRRREKEKAPD